MTNESTAANSIEELTFEQAFQRLDDVAKKLEAGGLSVEDSVRLYEEGVALAKMCNQRLDSAELKITTLQRDDPPSEPAGTDES